jgi:anti-sigma regulatory factor (Ser/Thr protein kinase)
METELLTTDLVEEIQNALNVGVPLDSTVSGIQEATLPGLVEYGCLRWTCGLTKIPPLPRAVVSSALGKALFAVSSELGLRSAGESTRPPGGIGTQLAEFTVRRTKEDLGTTEWESFEIRFNRSAQSVGFAQIAGDGLQAALREMTENALIHAESPVPVLVGYRVLDGVAQFCVADVGMGVLGSLRTCPDYQHLRVHNEAIREALKDGTSRYGRNKGGFGFRQVFKALTAQWGHLRFRSGEGCITMDGTDLAADRGQEHFPPFLPGFQVSITCRSTPSPLPATLV